MPCPAVITIPHNSPQQTSAAFLADLVNTMSNTCPALRTLHYSPTHHILTKYTPTHYTSHIQRDSQRCKHNTQTSPGSVSGLTINLLWKQMSPSRGWVKCTVSVVSSLCYSRLYKLTICWASPNICEVHKSICILSSHTVYIMVCIIIMTECCSQSSRYAFAINHVTLTGVQTMLCKF